MIDPTTWTSFKTIRVMDQNNKPLSRLNELEIVHTNNITEKYMFANEFQTNHVHLVELASGKVVKTWNL